MLIVVLFWWGGFSSRRHLGLFIRFKKEIGDARKTKIANRAPRTTIIPPLVVALLGCANISYSNARYKEILQ